MPLSLRSVLLPVASAFSKLVMSGFTFLMLWLDVGVFHTQILEWSFTEISQELMLFACALLFWFAPARQADKGLNVLASGVFLCLLMRELDGLFDPISHSFWCIPVLVIALGSCLRALRPAIRQRTLSQLLSFAQSPTFAALSTGFAVLVFSRVFGMGSFWHLVLSDGYGRIAKTAAEEGLELLAYSLWLLAASDYHLQCRLGLAIGKNLRLANTQHIGAAPRPAA